MLKTEDITPSTQTTETAYIYRFGEFEMDFKEETLFRNGEKLRINRRSFQVLRLLVERAGEVVTKQEFAETVWTDTFVEDNSLTVTMTMLRKILGDDYKQPQFIENLPRKGYRFIADVKVIENPPPSAQVEEIIGTASPLKNKSELNLKNRKTLVGIFAVCLLVLTAVVGFSYFGHSPAVASAVKQSNIESIAVLPFENQNSDTEYLSDGLTESVINNLGALPNLRVISRSSVFEYKHKSIDLPSVGRELGAQMILSGKLTHEADNLIINAELTDLRDNRQIWSRRYTRPTTDAFALQQEISKDITESLPSKLTEAELTKTAKRQTDNPEAFLLYLKGRYYWNNRSAKNMEKAINYFNQAIEKDPTYALAYVGLADSYALGYSNDRWALTQATADRALEIDENIGEAYAVKAVNDCFHKWDWANAEKEYRRALELSPNYATAHHWFAEFLALEGRFDESFSEYNRAVELDPLSLAVKSDLGATYLYAGQPDRAIEYLQNLKKINPNYPRTYWFLKEAYEEKGMFAEAIDEYVEMFRVQGDDSPAYDKEKERLLTALQTSGAKGYWQTTSQLLLEKGKSGPFEFAYLSARLNDREKTFEFLEKSYAERNAAMTYLKVRHEFDKYHSDPRFISLINRVGLPQ